MSDPEEWCTRQEAAEMLGVDVRTIDRYCRRRLLTKYRLKGTQGVRLKVAEVGGLFVPAIAESPHMPV